MKFTVEIDLTNEAFAEGIEGTEVARILNVLAADVAFGPLRNEYGGSLRTIEGKRVGHWGVSR